MSSLIVEVCEIKDIYHHPNADKLDIAVVKGWNCIVQRDSYSIGDWVIFFPPDCILPDWLIEKYELGFLKRGGRVGTLKLRGFISQGLILPTECLLAVSHGGYVVGDNVADVLGIKKYEVAEIVTSKHGNITSRKVQNSYFSKYTEIENINNFDGVFQDGDVVVITEKIHGSNIRFGRLPIEINFRNGDWLGILRSLWKKYILRQIHEFVYGSHNVQLQWNNQKNFYDKNIYAEVLKNYDLENLPEDYIYYGEVYGKGVQELEYGKPGLSLAIFDIKDIKTSSYMNWEDVRRLCSWRGFTPVPHLYVGEFHEDILINETIGNSVIEPTQIREGCVVKMLTEENHPKLGRKILKSINPEYLARKNRTEFK